MMRAARGIGTRDTDLKVCPHCWHVNRYAARLCAGCKADMSTLLQETGGLRQTAPVQSPIPVRARLSATQRLVVLGFMALYALSLLIPALRSRGPLTPPPASTSPVGAGVGGE